MPGEVSSSYDPEFGTGENAGLVRQAVLDLKQQVSRKIGDETLLPILDVVAGHFPTTNRIASLVLNERELRVLRFALNRALESL